MQLPNCAVGFAYQNKIILRLTLQKWNMLHHCSFIDKMFKKI